MTVHVQVCRHLAAPPAAVWATLARIDRHPEWMADARSIVFRTDARAGVGTEFECLTAVGPLRTVDVMTVTEWRTGEAIGIEHRGMVTGRGRFALAPDGAGTRCCWDERLRFPWWLGGPVGERVAKPVLTRLWTANLARLAAIVEVGDGPPGVPHDPRPG